VSCGRRAFSQGLFFATVTLLAAPAFAGSYLNRAALLIGQGRREGEFLRAHFADKELAHTVHRMATARVEAASTMMVPKEVVQAHPHLLLVFENYERAADACKNSQVERFIVFLQRALDEERTFRAVLKQFGWDLPGTGDERGR
jgi:hypothetical protein